LNSADSARPAQLPDWLLLIALPVLLHAPEMIGWLKTDPRLLTSGLGIGVRGGWVGQAGFLDPNSGWTAQDLGHYAAEQWLHGRVPWWNPCIGVGMPLAAEMQPAALFLPFVLLLHFQNGWLWLHIVLQCIAATGTYALLRGLGLSRAASLLGAALYAGHGTFAWFSHGPERAAAFLPWLLHGVERCRADRAGAAMLAVALAASLYAGWPETAFLDGLLVAAWSLLRLAQAPRRLRLAAHIGGGALAGLLLAAPAILPFAGYLPLGDAGPHDAMAGQYLPGAGIAMLLLPYVNGPIAAMGQPMWALWGQVGGYVGIAALMLAVYGALGRGSQAGLRRLLLVWLLICVARAAGFGPAQWLSNLIPLVGQTAFSRYVVPVLAMPVAVLAACAIDDWRTAPARARGLAACAFALALIAWAAWCCRGMAAQLWAIQLYRELFIGSICWAAAVTLGLSLLLQRRPGRVALCLIGLLICADTGGCYLLARAAAPRLGSFDLAPARFLQAHAGLARIVSLGGGLGINEAAWFGLAAVPGTSLPVPLVWSDFVRSQFGADAVLFHYDNTAPSRLLRDATGLRALGVGWLTTGRGQGPAHQLGSVDQALARRAETLAADRPVSGDLPQGLPGAGPLTHVGVDIGTFAGRSDGVLRLSLSAPGLAATGATPIAGAADNAALDIPLDHPVPAGRPVRWTLTQTGGRNPVALWRYGPAGAIRFSTDARWPGIDAQPQLAFAGRGMEVYRLPGAAPYWDAGPCGVHAVTRLAATTRCAAPGALLRRELFFPGWAATANGRPAPIRQDGLFQRIDLPAGQASIRFSYAPPGIGYACLAGILGLIMAGWLALKPPFIRTARAVTPTAAPPTDWSPAPSAPPASPAAAAGTRSDTSPPRRQNSIAR
jgi:hypothetical protein